MPQVNQKVRSGNRIIVVLDGVAVGLLQSIRGSDDYGPEPASGIGDIHAVEYVPTMARHTVSISKMVLDTETIRSLGIFPENGDAALKGLVFDIEQYDKDTGSLLRKWVGCSYASGDLDISKHSIAMSSGTFNALDVVGVGI